LSAPGRSLALVPERLGREGAPVSASARHNNERMRQNARERLSLTVGNNRRSMLTLIGAGAAAVLGAGCERRDAPAAGPQYEQAPPSAPNAALRFAIHPLHNPLYLAEVYQPLIDHLNRLAGKARFELEASTDYAQFEAKLRARAVAVALPNPWQTLLAMRSGYRVIAMAGDADDFRGLFIARRDSPLRDPVDLRGRAVAYPSPTAVAACLMPQWFLHQAGIDVVREIDNRYVVSQESSILSAHRGDVAAGATWPPPWRAFQRTHPREAAELRVVWQTPPLVNNSVMVRDDLPPALADWLRATLLGLGASGSGRQLLERMETAAFHAADDRSYEPVREFVARFEREVRPVVAAR
jgi:phosphonate transport system substrate-binding protein